MGFGTPGTKGSMKRRWGRHRLKHWVYDGCGTPDRPRPVQEGRVMSVEENEAVVRRYFDEFWDHRNVALAPEIFLRC